MKNRVRLRVMDIDGEKYLWSYNYDDMDFLNYPYSVPTVFRPTNS